MLNFAAILLFIASCTDSSDTIALGEPDTDVNDTSLETGELDIVPGHIAAWSRDERAAPGSITVNEVMYNSPAGDEFEWIELYNPMVLDMDVSGWQLTGGVEYRFAEGATIPAGGFLVIAANPAALAEQSGFAEAIGPYAGVLANEGERFSLHNNMGRLIDTIGYGTDQIWPVKADGSGLSLAKLKADAASDHAENWTASDQLGGTPGRANLVDPLTPPTMLELVAPDATWSYDFSGEYPASDWAHPDYDDSRWLAGQATFYAGAAQGNVVATARVTADNYFALYLGNADGSNLRLAGEDSDGDWTTVDAFELTVTPQDHLYLAAWEAPWDYGGPQMTIAEVELSDSIIGTSTVDFEWALGPVDGCPGTPDPPPTEDAVSELIEVSNAGVGWANPAVEADNGSDPWGWALGGWFDADTKYVWADTFSDTSITNIDNTYVLFRSVAPLLSAGGTTELPDFFTTTTFRTAFSFDENPTATNLSAECLLDDGAVVYLNGVEVFRYNMPAGAVDASTLASAEITNTTQVYADISADALVRGTNVLAVELHQAMAEDTDLAFGCSLTARVSAENIVQTLVLNEVAGSDASPFWAELLSVSESAVDTAGLILATSAGDEYILPTNSIESGEFLAVADLGFSPRAGDVLYLYSADRSTLIDAVRVQTVGKGRETEGGPWRFSTTASPGAANLIDLVHDIVITEIQYHRAPLSREGQSFGERPEEWIELFNRGSQEIDLSGWQLVDAVAFELPSGTVLASGAYLVVSNDADALRSDYPDAEIIGDLSGQFANGGERILLIDARGNPADEVRYFDGGRWPETADGGGSSLELLDYNADNAVGGAWAASDERHRTEWVTYRYRGEAVASAVGPDGTWEELVMGLLDSGEVLIDDVSVIQDPDSAALEIVQNGRFDNDNDHWRLLGNHRKSDIIPDPDDPGNTVLRLVATGPTGHMHNHAETTLLQPVSNREYEISFRARWVSGSNQLNSRLYFNRMPVTTLVDQPELSGTPGAPNSTKIDNLGPTFADLRQDVAVPSPYEPVGISISVNDPDGVASATLWTSVAGAPFAAQPMTESQPGRWEAQFDGQQSGAIVQFYVEAVDSVGFRSTFPASGADSRALLTFDDGKAATNGLHNFRILITQADSDWLHDDVNLMSDEGVGATIVYNESEIFYDVAIRTKGSQRGRPEQPRLGYGVSFHTEQPFRGSHSSALIDRSEGVGYGQREVLMNLVMVGAGSVSGEYNDLVHALTPLSEHTGPAELQLDRFTGLVLDAQFADGASGELFEYELIYYPLTTNDSTPEGLKLPQPDYVVGTPITDLGDDKESYRWNFLIQNNERGDDYERLIDLGQTFALSDADFLDEAPAIIDVDQWLRAFAFATLSGAIDNYGGDGSQHNARFYVRPDDGKVLYFPHDLDFFGSSQMSIVGNGDLARLLADPANKRAYYGHLQDIVSRSYSTDYLAPWCTQMATLLPGQNVAGNCQFIDDRADWVMYGSSDAVMTRFPSVGFAITTSGGANFSVAATEVALEGKGWIDVRQVLVNGVITELTWLDETNWRISLPLVEGANALELVATDLHGTSVGSDSIVVTSTGG